MKITGLKATLALMMITICLMFCVWQGSLNTQLQSKINNINRSLALITEKQNAVKAEIAECTTPEFLFAQSIVDVIETDNVTTITICDVASNF